MTEPIRSWLSAVARLLRAPEPLDVRELGAARILSANVDGHRLEIGCGRDFWVDAVVEWPSLPAHVFLIHAPVDSYSRAKYLEDGEAPLATGHPEFDATYLIFNLDADLLATTFPRLLQDALVAAAPFAPAISARDSSGAREASPSTRHVRVRPDIRADPNGSMPVTLGEQRFTPEHCAQAVEALIPLVKVIGSIAAGPSVPAEAIVRSGTGTYTWARNDTFVGARVRVDLTVLDGGALEVRCSAGVFSELGQEKIDPEAPGFVAWRRGAEMGLRVGAELAGLSSGVAEVRSILGTFVDTSEGAVAAAAALALWEAFGFEPPASARARLDEIAVQYPFPFGAAP